MRDGIPPSRHPSPHAPIDTTDPQREQWRRDALIALLWDLDGVQQDPHYHPEGDALFHSLQVFQQAQTATDDPLMWAAALFHDIGKAEGTRDHASRGARWLDALDMPEDLCWLVAHHMDLLQRRSRQRLYQKNDPRLPQLEALRRWDQAGRDPHAIVTTPEDAVDALLWAMADTPMT